MNSPKDPRRGRPSASSMQRYHSCNGSWLLERNVPLDDRLSSKDAERGTMLHEANHVGDVSNLTLSDADFIERVRQQEEQIFLLWRDEFNIPMNDIEIIRERRWWLMEGGSRMCSAQLDFVAISQKRRQALILDLKSGRKEVAPPPSNLQLRTGAVILTANYSLIHCRVGIVQPWAKTQPRTDYSADQLFEAWTQLSNLLKAIENPAATRNPGPHCEYCPARATCPEAVGVVSALTSLKGLSWSSLPAQQKIVLWEKAKAAKSIIKQIEDLAKKELTNNPAAIPGLMKNPDGSQRSITSVIKAYTLLQNAYQNLKPEELNEKFDSFCTLSIGALEKWVRETQGGTEDNAKAWVNKELAECMGFESRSGSVVRVKEAE